MKYTVEYAKRDEARFLSHLEVSRVFERAFRRAALPLALSQGFNPHPYLSFALPLGVGIASRSEYLEAELSQTISEFEVASRLKEELPGGFVVKAVTMSPETGRALSGLVEAAVYQALPFWKPQPESGLIQNVVSELMAGEEILAADRGKERNIREGVWRLRVKAGRLGTSITMLLAAGSRLHVRPEWVVAALTRLGGWTEDRPPLLTRLGLFRCRGGRLIRMMPR